MANDNPPMYHFWMPDLFTIDGEVQEDTNIQLHDFGARGVKTQLTAEDRAKAQELMATCQDKLFTTPGQLLDYMEQKNISLHQALEEASSAELDLAPAPGWPNNPGRGYSPPMIVLEDIDRVWPRKVGEGVVYKGLEGSGLYDLSRVGDTPRLPLVGKKINRFDPIDFAKKHTQPEGSGAHLQLVFKDGQPVQKVGGIITLADIRRALDELSGLARTIEGSGTNDQVATNIAKVIAMPEGRGSRFTLPPED